MSRPLPIAVKTAFVWLGQNDPAVVRAAAQKTHEGDGQTSEGERRKALRCPGSIPTTQR